MASKENELITLTDGRRVAIDRSVGVVMLCYTIVANNIYILANQRGVKTSEFKSKWNLPSGYLNWNEDGKEAARRETAEETGLCIPVTLIQEVEHSTSPTENRQNVIFRYAAKVPNYYMNQSLKALDLEEVFEVKWVNFKDLDTIEWAFNQKETIKRMLSKLEAL